MWQHVFADANHPRVKRFLEAAMNQTFLRSAPPCANKTTQFHQHSSPIAG